MGTQRRAMRAASLAATMSMASAVLARQDQAPAPTPAAVAGAAGSAQPVAAASPTVIVVRSVKGKVMWRASPEAEKKSAKAGDVLPEGAEVFTSVNAAIEIQVGAGQVFTLDRLGKFILREAIASQGKEKTTVQVPYGRVQFEVNSATVANDVKIQAPDATLAVKGTSGGVEVSPGFPTLAFGGEFNKGVFDVDFARAITTTFRGSEKASAQIPAIGEYAQEKRFVDTNDIWSHDGDEAFTIRDFQTVLFVLLEIVLRDLVPEAPFDVFFLDEATSNLYRSDIFGTGGLVGNVSGASNSGRGTGAAIVYPPNQGGLFGTLIRLESGQGSAELLALDLNHPDTGFQSLGSVNSFAGRLTGLGALGSQLYAVQDLGPTTPDLIARIVSDGKGGFDVLPAMNLGIQLEDSLSGVTPAGVLLAPGRLPTGTGLSNGTPGVLGPNGVIFEVDPRNNYLSGAVSDFTDSFAPGPNTDVEPGLVINSVPRITGTSIVTDLSGTPILIVTTNATVNGQPNTTLINIFTVGADGNTRLAVVRRSTFRIEGLAGESRGTVPAPTTLSAAPSAGLIDGSLDSLFAAMAFSTDAVASGVVERLIANQIIQTARDPSGCAASAELHMNLSAAISNHIDQRSGTGATVYDFRSGLPLNHPCLAPGPGPGGSQLVTSLFYVDEFTGDIIARDLAGNEAPVRPGDGESKPVLGAAAIGNAASRTLLTLTNFRALDGSLTPTITGYSLTNPSAAPTTLASFPRQDLGGGISRSYDLAGLASVGSQVYASGFQNIQGDQTGAPQLHAAVYEIAGGALSERAAPQMALQAGALAGAPARGTVYMLGQIPGTAGAAGAFQLAGSGANAVLLEVDPRNNYLVSAQSADQGDFNVQPATPTNGIDPATITRVTGMTYLGNTLVMNAVTQSGQSVIVQYNPGATNLPSDPHFRRFDAFPPSTRPRELAGEGTGSPPAPFPLNPSSSPIDTTTINRTFAMMAYSGQAAASGVVRALVAEHVAATSVNPAGCRASAELNGPSLQGFLNQHINQQAGVGQTVQQFRGSLPPNHPCRGQGG